MKQAIAGVAPPELGEVGSMTVWPSIAATQPGQVIGRLCSIPAGVSVFTVGHLLALLLIPPAVGLLLMTFNPWTCRRYRLTNRRLVVQKGMMPVDERSVAFDDFDVVEIDVLPGQPWYPAGDLVFSKGPLEVFRISGVRNPEGFRHACQAARDSFVAIQQVMQATA